MISKATDAFWKAYRDLPDEIKQRARTAYRLWQENPAHPSLRFKQVHATEPIYSVRIVTSELQVERTGHQRGGIIVSYRSPPFTNTLDDMINLQTHCADMD